MSRDKWPPGHKNPAVRFCWGVNRDYIWISNTKRKNGAFRQKRWANSLGKSAPAVRIPHRNSQSIGRGRFSNYLPPPPQKTRSFGLIFFQARAVSSNKSSYGEFSFFGRRRANFWRGGGGITSKLARQLPLWGIYKHALAAFWRKRRLLYCIEKKVAKLYISSIFGYI